MKVKHSLTIGEEEALVCNSNEEIEQTMFLSPRLFVGKSRIFMFDVDGTLIDIGRTSPELLPLLYSLKEEGHSLGLCSSRSPVELRRIVVDKLGADLGPQGLFDAGFILEDGHVWVPPRARLETDARVLTSPEALAEMEIFKAAFQAAWKPATEPLLRDQRWGFIDGVPDPPVRLVAEEGRLLGSISIFEKGPEVTSPDYRGEYDAMSTWAQALIRKFNLQYVEAGEVGNGTLRVIQIGVTKGTTLSRVVSSLSQVVYIGNGFNDVPVAQVVRAAAGLVMAVSNSPVELQQLAHYVASQPASDGVVELLKPLVRRRIS